MSGSRWRFLAVIGVISVLLGLFLRDAIYDLVVVPIAYFLWIARFYYLAIPQWALWVALLVVIFVAVAGILFRK